VVDLSGHGAGSGRPLPCACAARWPRPLTPAGPLRHLGRTTRSTSKSVAAMRLESESQAQTPGLADVPGKRSFRPCAPWRHYARAAAGKPATGLEEARQTGRPTRALIAFP
jgi:hypothetical protein